MAAGSEGYVHVDLRCDWLLNGGNLTEGEGVCARGWGGGGRGHQDRMNSFSNTIQALLHDSCLGAFREQRRVKESFWWSDKGDYHLQKVGFSRRGCEWHVNKTQVGLPLWVPDDNKASDMCFISFPFNEPRLLEKWHEICWLRVYSHTIRTVVPQLTNVYSY